MRRDRVLTSQERCRRKCLPAAPSYPFAGGKSITNTFPRRSHCRRSSSITIDFHFAGTAIAICFPPSWKQKHLSSLWAPGKIGVFLCKRETARLFSEAPGYKAAAEQALNGLRLCLFFFHGFACPGRLHRNRFFPCFRSPCQQPNTNGQEDQADPLGGRESPKNAPLVIVP